METATAILPNSPTSPPDLFPLRDRARLRNRLQRGDLSAIAESLGVSRFALTRFLDGANTANNAMYWDAITQYLIDRQQNTRQASARARADLAAIDSVKDEG